MPITRTIKLDDLTPHELALVFTEMTADAQADFFANVWCIAKAWPGAGWCQQSYGIVEHLDSDGRQAIETLAAHLAGDGDA